MNFIAIACVQRLWKKEHYSKEYMAATRSMGTYMRLEETAAALLLWLTGDVGQLAHEETQASDGVVANV